MVQCGLLIFLRLDDRQDSILAPEPWPRSNLAHPWWLNDIIIRLHLACVSDWTFVQIEKNK
jgi:hypothetical protein